jgi:hypothetical protein
MQAKDFLLSECKNLNSVLQQTLRYEYGLEGSREFYEECEARLAHIEKELTQIANDDFDGLSDSSIELENLSSLICRIERSSLGEYSWPFVEEFKHIAKAVCTEPSSLKPGVPPKVHVLSEGGLSAYSIYTEPNRSISQKRILTIIFPRTLKHFVLLHPILGHEIGHAIYSYAQYQHDLNKIFLSNLVLPSTNFHNEQATVNWLYSANAPKGVQLYLIQLSASLSVDAKNFFYSFAYYDAWIEEFLCDFIGLLMFGPSFLAAHCNLLYSIDPSGMSVSDYHPLTGCRVNMLLTAAEIMGYDSLVFDPALQPAVNTFWAELKSKRLSDKWFDLFTDDQIRATLVGLEGFLAQHENALYPKPTIEQIQPLVKKIIELTPPVGYEFDEQNGPNCTEVDFRHTLYAGWIASSDTKANIPFDTVNRLCEHGIMQQGAIKLKKSEEAGV